MAVRLFVSKMDGAIFSFLGGFVQRFLNQLAPQDTNSTDLHVGIDTSSSGAKSGTATLALVSDGSDTSGLGQTNLSSQTVNVSADVYRLANPVLNTANIDLAARVGDASPSANISISNSSPDSFTEGLKATPSAASAPFSVGGSISNLGAGATDSSIQIGLNTATAGAFTETVNTQFVSTGAGTTGAADLSVGAGNTSLDGKVYQAAQAQVNNAPLDFGIVHVGDVVAQKAVSVTNAAPFVGLNDTLNGTVSSTSAAFTASGAVTGLNAGNTDTNGLKVGLNTVTAGIFSDTVTASFNSHNPDMVDLGLPDVMVGVKGQVNNYANPDFDKVSGAGSLSGSGLSFDLNFGTVLDDSGIIETFLSLANDVFGPADAMDGDFNLAGADEFGLSGFNFFDLGAGMVQNGLKVSLDTNALSLGSVSDTVLMNVRGYNPSGFEENFQVALNLKGVVAANNGDVPEPESLALMLIGLGGFMFARRRSKA
jgi:hypothetical protein